MNNYNVANIEIPNILINYKLIPLHNNSKVPKKGMKWGSNNVLEFDGKETGYAVDTGRSNLIVVDCDSNNDVDGVNDFLDYYYSKEGDYPETFSVETPNEGRHYYFNASSNIRINSSISTLMPGVDIRANGGYIVGPGSKVKDKNNNIKEYLIEDEYANILDIPEWLLIELSSHTESQTFHSSDAPRNKTQKLDISKSSNDKVLLNWAITKVENAQPGERQKVLNNVSLFMGHGRVPRGMAEAVITVAENIGLSANEARRTFEHGYNDGLAKEEYDFEQISVHYNIEIGSDFKTDPLDTTFYTHLSLSHNFAKKYENNFIYWAVDSSWYVYNESKGCWEQVAEQYLYTLVDNFLDELVTNIRKEILNLPSQIYRIQEKLWAKTYTDAVVFMCRNRFIRTENNLFDNDPYLINCKNGIVNLKTGELLKSSRDLYITKYIPIDYYESARDNYCDTIINSVHPDEQDYLQIMAGQSLVGEQPKSQIALFFHGRGSNGKSTFLDLLLKTSGDYGKLQPPGVLLSDKNGGDKYALADFDGLRTVVIEELPNSKVLDTGALKRLVGTQKMNARAIYSKNREFDNESTIFVSCNRLPMINETDHGTWRRVIVITFPYSFKSTKDKIKNEWDRLGDAKVLYAARRNRKTAEAFLSWRVQGAVKALNDPSAEINVPEHILQVVNEWNENNDLLLSWFNDMIDCSEDTEKYYITFEDLWLSYNEHLLSKGNSKVSMRLFSEQLTNHTVYFDNRLIYKKNTSIRKELVRSIYYPRNDNIDYTPKPTIKKGSYIERIKFK